MHTAQTLSETPKSVAELGDELSRQLSSGELDLPLFPATAFKVFRLAQDPDSNVGQVAELIEKDQKIASGVLRVANSVAFGGSIRIATLRQAVTRTGLKVLGEIVLSTAFRSSVYENQEHFDQMHGYWREGLGAALWGKELARLRKSNVESAYMCGLLHNIGKPLALKFLASLDPDTDGPRMIEQTNELAPLVGAQVADLWNLPPVAKSCIAFHEHYGDALDFREDACAVHASLLLTRHMFDDNNCPREDLERAPSLAQLNVYPDDLDQLLTKKKRLTTELESY